MAIFVACLVGTALASPVGGRTATYAPIYTPPYYYENAYSSTSCDWLICGSNNVYADAGAASTGQALEWTESTATVLEGATASATVRFVQPIQNVPSNGTYRVSYLWDLSWSTVDLATCIPALGASYALSSINVEANVLDATNASWVVNGGTSATVYSSSQLCPLTYSSSSMASDWVEESFNAYLQVGHSYWVYLELVTTTTAFGLLIGTATAEASVGIDAGGSAYLATITVSEA